MESWIGNLEQLALDNTSFRDTPHTAEHLQLTLMCLEPNETIGREVHAGTDQLLRIEQGRGRIEIGSGPEQVDERYDLVAGDAVIVAAGTWHELVNIGPEELKLYSIYAPPHHAPHTLHRTKTEAQAAEHAAR